jgi:hypothetical protein
MEPPAETPFPFVVGESRSGTTLLRVMLDAHPAMAVPPESYFITGLHKHRDRYAMADGRFDLPRFARDLEGMPRFKGWDLPKAEVDAAFAAPLQGDFAGAIRLLYATYARFHGKRRYADKSPGYVSRMRLLGRVFEEARFVHVIRDVRSVALSLAEMPWGTTDVALAAARWRHRVGGGRAAGQELGPERYVEVRYEDLVADPEATLTTLGSFLVLPFDPAMLAYSERGLERIPEAERYMHANVARPPTTGLRDWRTQMKPGDLEAVEAVAGDLMADLGYERSVAQPSVAASKRAQDARAEWERYLSKKKRKGKLFGFAARFKRRLGKPDRDLDED